MNPLSKLFPVETSQDKRRRALRLYRQGVSTTVIAQRLGVTPRTIRRYIRNAKEADRDEG